MAELLPNKIDKRVINLVKVMQSTGAATSYNIVIGVAVGIVCASDRSILKENGGKIQFSRK